MYRHILVAVDGSEHAERAIAEAAKLVLEGEQTKLTLLHVSPPIPAYVWADVAQLDLDLAGMAEQDARELVQKQAQFLDEKGIAYDVATAVGEPGREIALTARDLGCDLIVVGSRGRGQVAGIFLGSVSSRVLQEAKCPVLVVK